MGQFVYKAVNQTGERITGHIEAADRKGAVAALTEKGQFVLELQPKTKPASKQIESDILPLVLPAGYFFTKRIRSKDILAFTSQLSTALRAGLPLLEAIEIIRDQQHKPALRYILDDIADSVRSGHSLSDAMSRHPKIFSSLYLSMIRVGETGGILEKTTAQMASLLARDEKVKTSMKNASAYPMFVLSLGIISVIVVVTWVLPNILKTLGGEVAILPWPTKLLLAVSNFFVALFTTVQGWLFIILIAAGLIFLGRWLKAEGRVRLDSFRLSIPVLGNVLRTIAVGRFARTLGALTKGGVTILESLGVVRDTLGNEVLGREIDKVSEKVKTGSSLAEPLGQSGLFPPLLIQITAVGEQTGKLDELLLNAADTFDEEADAAVNRFMAVFPAALILFLALVIGFIIVATLLPVVMMSLGTTAL
jgi:type II secretory pathway component PulF